MSFQEAFKQVIGEEGKYSNNPNDPGGATKYGIIERVARANGYQGDIKDLSLGFAQKIYKQQYWDLLNLDPVCSLGEELATKLFDISVNMGIVTAGNFFQQALNTFNRNGKDYPDLTVDSHIGPQSLSALITFRKVRGAPGMVVLLRAINCLQAARYIALSFKTPTLEDFEFGWFLNRVS